MSEANKHQVGGTHYQTEYQHWDMVLDMGVGYLAGCATKYVSRWRKKNGLEDLKKALHYVNKMMENASKCCDAVAMGPEGYDIAKDRIDTFARVNGLGEQEADCCQYLALARSPADLYKARGIVLALMEQADRAVPLEDSNKHADRTSALDILASAKPPAGFDVEIKD